MRPNEHSTDAGTCPSQEELLAFNEGRLSLDRLETVGCHLSTCPPCADVLRGLEAAAQSLFPGRPTAGVIEAATRACSPPTPGQLGQYQLFEVVGQGGMGTVHRALHTRLKRWVALKILPAERVRDARSLARFQGEMEAVGRLEHRNIIRATDAGEAEGLHFLVMELVDGIDLARLVQQVGPLPLADACELARQTALGLQYVHEHQMVHRDIKPSNLMLTRDGEVRILDLGLALIHGDRAAGAELTETGTVMGTTDYMAPEQWEDTHAVDIRADLYSLGCTLYKLLTGEAPFSGPAYRSPARKKRAHAGIPVPAIGRRRSDVAAELAAVLDRLLAKRAADRFATPAEAAAALARFTAGSDLRGLAARATDPPTVRQTDRERGDPAETSAPRGQTLPPGSRQRGQAPARPPRRRGLRFALLGCLAVGLAAVLAVGRWPQTAPAGKGKLPENETVPAAAEIGKWLALRHEPQRLWPRKPVDDFQARWEESRQALRVDSAGLSLFALGTATQRSYRIQVGLTETEWHGGIGVFIGYRQLGGTGPPHFRCQIFALAKTRDRQAFAIERQLLSISPSVPEGVPLTTASGVSRVPVPRPANSHEHILDIHVKLRRVEQVIWNGQRLTALVKPEWEGRISADDQRGVFGVYSFRSNGIFRDARFMVLGE